MSKFHDIQLIQISNRIDPDIVIFHNMPPRVYILNPCFLALMALFLSDTPNDALIGHVGLVSLPALFLIAPLTVIFAPIGVKLGKILNQNQLKKVFAVTLFFTGLRMLYKAY